MEEEEVKKKRKCTGKGGKLRVKNWRRRERRRMRPGCLARPAEHRKDSGAARLWLRTEEKGRKIAGTLNGHLGPLTMGRGAIYPLCLTSSRCFFVRLPLALDSVLHSQ